MQAGQLIRFLRGDATQTAFASRLGVSQPVIADWERGRRVPSKGNIDRLRDLFPQHREMIANTLLTAAPVSEQSAAGGD